MRHKLYILVLVAGMMGTALSPAQAKTAKPLGSFGGWKAYMLSEDKQPVCYMVLTAPTAKSYLIRTKIAHPKKGKSRFAESHFGRNDAHLLITHRPAEGSIDVVSYEAGYSYKPTSDAKVRIGKESFSLFTQQDTAWARDNRTDHLLTAAIRKNDTFIVTGQPSHPGATALTDKIDLAGADPAYHAISKACGLEKEAVRKSVKVNNYKKQ